MCNPVEYELFENNVPYQCTFEGTMQVVKISILLVNKLFLYWKYIQILYHLPKSFGTIYANFFYQSCLDLVGPHPPVLNFANV